MFSFFSFETTKIHYEKIWKAITFGYKSTHDFFPPKTLASGVATAAAVWASIGV